MATEVYKKEELTLQDGTDITVRPLPVGRLRRFMDAWKEMANVESEDDGFDVFVNCAGIGIEHEFKGKFDALKASGEEKAKGEVLSAEYKEYCEDVLDMDTIYRILEVAGNLRLNDPKVMEAAERAAAALEAGTK